MQECLPHRDAAQICPAGNTRAVCVAGEDGAQVAGGTSEGPRHFGRVPIGSNGVKSVLEVRRQFANARAHVLVAVVENVVSS